MRQLLCIDTTHGASGPARLSGYASDSFDEADEADNRGNDLDMGGEEGERIIA